MIQQNHMVMGREPDPHFREPSKDETDAAVFDVVRSYCKGADRWDLHRFLGETILEELAERARLTDTVPCLDWDKIVDQAAARIVKGWTPEDWSAYRG